CRACLAPACQDRPRDAGEVAARMASYQAAVQKRLRQAELERAAAQARAAVARATAAAERKARARTRAPAASGLALVVLGAAGGLLLQRQAAERRADQARREAGHGQAVQSALERAAELGRQSRCQEARVVLDQARQGLGDGGPDDLRQELDGLDAE